MQARPQSAQAEQWVNGGTESAIERKPKGPTKRLTLDLPVETHRRLKIACAETGKDMVEVIRGWIDQNLDSITAKQ